MGLGNESVLILTQLACGQDLRDLQSRINEIIISVQNITANPKVRWLSLPGVRRE